MHNTPLRKTAVLAVSMALLIAAVSSGAVTYAAFSDSGDVDVTFTAGNFSGSSEVTISGTNVVDSDETDNITATDNTTTDNTTATDNTTTDNTTDSDDTTTNETSRNTSDQISSEDLPITNGLDAGRTTDAVPAAAATAVGQRHLPAAPPQSGG